MLTGLVSLHRYCPLSVLSTGLIWTVLLSSEKETRSEEVRGCPSFIHSLVLMSPVASQLRLEELLVSSIRVAEELEAVMVAPVMASVKQERVHG